MKTLLILRHAKSSWASEGLADHDRPLNDRGERDAPRIGRLLQEQQLLPDRVLCSTAKRALQTARKVVAGAECDSPIEMLSDLYLAAPSTHVEVLQRQASSAECLLVVAHNPGLEDFVSRLVGQQITLPTAALAQVELEIDSWNQLSMQTAGTLVNLWLPRELE